MKPYCKIQTVFKRDPENKFRTLLDWEYAEPEFRYLADNEWIFTEKVDGTSIRVMFDGVGLSFGGKTDNSDIPAKLVNRLQEIFNPQVDKLQEVFPDGVCLYGEGYGAGIQKGGGNYSLTQDFVLFDVMVGDWWLQWQDVADVAYKLDLREVPIVGQGNLAEMVVRVKEGFWSNWGEFTAEGIVARPAQVLMTRAGRRIITKVKHKDFKPPVS